MFLISSIGRYSHGSSRIERPTPIPSQPRHNERAGDKHPRPLDPIHYFKIVNMAPIISHIKKIDNHLVLHIGGPQSSDEQPAILQSGHRQQASQLTKVLRTRET